MTEPVQKKNGQRQTGIGRVDHPNEEVDRDSLNLQGGFVALMHRVINAGTVVSAPVSAATGLGMDEPHTQELHRNLERTPVYVKRHKTTPEDAICGCADEV